MGVSSALEMAGRRTIALMVVVDAVTVITAPELAFVFCNSLRPARHADGCWYRADTRVASH